MADGTQVVAGAGDTIWTEDVSDSRGKLQRTKIALGALDSDSGDVSGSNPMPVYVAAQSSGGATPYSYIAAASSNQDSQVVKNSAGIVKGLLCICTTANMRYLKIYDTASGPTSASTPKLRIPVPANGTSGSGLNFPLPPEGIQFSSGIAFRMTQNLVDNDATAVTASDLVLNVIYQ